MSHSLRVMWRLLAVAFLAAAGLVGTPASWAQAPAPETQLKIFHLREISADGAVEIVQRIFNGKQIRVALDERTNSLVLNGPTEDLQQIEAVLQAIDQPAEEHVPAKRALPPVQVRIYWLTTGAGGAVVPDVLAPVTAEMRELGIGELRLGGQMSVNVGVPGTPFTVSSSPKFGDEEALLRFQGNLGLGSNNQPVVNAQLECRSANGNHPIASLETSIEAPLNQFIVLGTTVASGDDSVFVLQLVPRPTEPTK